MLCASEGEERSLVEAWWGEGYVCWSQEGLSGLPLAALSSLPQIKKEGQTHPPAG